MTKGKTGQIMGMNFRLEQANIVGWLTRRETQAASKMDFAALLRQRTWRAPRITVAEIEEFLRELPHALISAKPITHRLLQQAIQDCQALLKPPAHQIRFMATEQKALAFVDGEGMEVAAAPVDDELTAVPEELRTGLLKSAEVAQVLEPLREWFNVPFTFLLLQPRWDLDEAIARSPTWTLWLRCIDANAKTLDLLDPFPPLKLIAQARFDEPAALCWNWEGKALVVNLDEALAISSSGIPKEAFWKELQNRKLTTQRTFQVLHLSDLHFGLKSTTKNLAYVEQHLVGEIQKLHRDGDFVQPVITGDLMNSPDDKSLAEFDAFRGRLVQHAGTPVVVVPGNHDVRKTGLLWKKLEPLADLEWSSVICNDEFKATFACFNTSIKAQLARGKIDAEQLQQVATKLTELKNLRPTRADYLRVALIHHHPFTTCEDERATVPGLGIPEEPFMRMEGGDLLVDWCAKLDIPLILHGHKHHPRFQGREIRVGNSIRPVRAVGSGSTTGADELPLCYNILTWSPSSQKWTVTYKSSPLNGTGFTEDRLLLG